MPPAHAKHRSRPAAAVLLLAALLAAASAQALKEDEEQPLYLEADSAELDDKRSLSVYTGNVFFRQGSLEIRADQVTVHHFPDRRPERIIAVGQPAKYRQEVEGEEEEVRGEALRMEYETASDEITFIDEAVLIQGEDTFRSDRIVYDRAAAVVKAGALVEGRERVKIFIKDPSRR